MANIPETRASLILRLPSTADAEAWRDFTSIYEPFVYRFARRGGLQDADASELVQNVMLAVARSVGRWQPDGNRARFRTWLFRIARNQLIDISSQRRRHATARGGTSLLGVLEQHPASDGFSSREIRLSHRRELLCRAADRVRSTFKDATWRAFTLTAIENRPVDDVARELGLTIGAVYIARSRVLTRLREEIKQWEDDDAM